MTMGDFMQLLGWGRSRYRTIASVADDDRRMGRAKRNPSPTRNHAARGDGFRFALLILRRADSEQPIEPLRCRGGQGAAEDPEYRDRDRAGDPGDDRSEERRVGEEGVRPWCIRGGP